MKFRYICTLFLASLFLIISSCATDADNFTTLLLKGDTNALEIQLNEKPSLINKLNSQGLAPLHEAVRKGDKTMIEYLLSKNADLNVRSKKGQSVLHYAVTIKSDAGPEIIRFLIEKGADVNAKDNEVTTPLAYGKRHGAPANSLYLLTRYGGEE